MKEEELIYNFFTNLNNPIVILEEKEDLYTIVYANKAMKPLLSPNEDEILEVPETFPLLIEQYKKKDIPTGSVINNVEIFGKLYNINFIQSENLLFMTFMEVTIDKMFDSLGFHDLGNACSAMIIVLNAEGKIVDMNECFLNFVGMKQKDIVKKDFFQTFIPGDKELLIHYFENIISEKSKSHHFITPLRDINKEIYKINWQISKVVRQDQNFIIAVGSDISKLVDQNNQFKREVESIKIGFEYFPFAIGYMNEKGFFTTMNKTFTKMFHPKNKDTTLHFDEIPFLKKNIGFAQMSEHIQLIKEMSYKIKHHHKEKLVNIKVDIKMLSAKSSSSKLYIVIVQKLSS
jgi:PAS domain S-box-containing protein